MNQSQIIIRDFLEKVILDKELKDSSLDDFNFQEMSLDDFCRRFELGDGFAFYLGHEKFPFEKWRDQFYDEWLKECQEWISESTELRDDYYRMVGAK